MDSLSIIQNRLRKELDAMNEIIVSSLATPNAMMSSVVSNYLKQKGKQLRPVMVIMSARFFGDITDDVLHAGAALEMLHNASLIHDDIVDETAMRRGRPTVNTIWGNHIAVLTGDFFVSNALAAGIRTGNLQVISALSELGKELSLGEIDQICNAREHHFDYGSYFEMIRKKTASLFRNCVRMGAETVGVREEVYGPLLDYGEKLGLCFQIKDDIFDYSPSAQIGKPTGNDLREGKVTLPLLYALAEGPQQEAERVRGILRRGDLTEAEIADAIHFAVENGGIEYAYRRMREIEREADGNLACYPDSEWKDAFRELFDYIISRDH